MSKYKINREFFPFTHFRAPINKPFLKLAAAFMKPPKFIYRDKELKTVKHKVKSFDGFLLDTFVISPIHISEPSPALIYIHGGGFVMEAAGCHYRNAMRYAKEVGCKVIFVTYRLAPDYPHPIFFEDCYATVCWAYDNADALGIDRERIGIGGDSAGSALSVGTCLMARDRNHPIRFVFQMLPYPFLDARNNSDSCKRFTDTPMWNSTLSSKIAPMTRADRARPDYIYYSPVEAESLEGLPPAYIETAEFDCLHDDGILYAARLRSEGIEVDLNETAGTMHGFDVMRKAPTSLAAVAARIDYMKKKYNKTKITELNLDENK